MDVHIPIAITTGLRRRGLDVLTSQDDGTDREDDEFLLNRSTQLGRVLLTQDKDYLRLTAEWLRAGRAFGGVLFAQQQRVSIGQLISDLELISRCCEPDEVQNRVTFLPLP
jgi:hypothetical protein